MDLTNITVEALNIMSKISGGFGIAIILLTVLVRLVMWPLSVQQQRSMKKMQMLSPKMKDIQTRYKNNPQVMQQKMMEFYKENQFNPMGGCMPLLLQLPVFILLYTALMSPQFMQLAGDSSFLFVHRLDQTMNSSDVISEDGKFGVSNHDKFSVDKKAVLTFKDGKTEDVKIEKPREAVKIQGELKPGEPVDLKISLDSFNLSFDELDKIKSAKVNVMNNTTREFETVIFERKNSLLVAQEPTYESKSSFNFDVFLLIALFGITMYLSQKILMKTNAQADMDPAQQAMQKSMSRIMPIMVIGMFIFVPIPAGVFLYMITSNVIQVLQTMIIDKQLQGEDFKKPSSGSTIEAEVVKKDS